MRWKEVYAIPTYESSSWYRTKGHGTGLCSHGYVHRLLSHALACKELEFVCREDLDAQIRSTDGLGTL